MVVPTHRSFSMHVSGKCFTWHGYKSLRASIILLKYLISLELEKLQGEVSLKFYSEDEEQLNHYHFPISLEKFLGHYVILFTIILRMMGIWSLQNVLEDINAFPLVLRGVFLGEHSYQWPPTQIDIFSMMNGLPRWLSSKESVCQSRRCRRRGFNPCVGKISSSKKWQPAPGFLSGKFHGQRTLSCYSPWGCKESNMTKHTCCDEYWVCLI